MAARKVASPLRHETTAQADDTRPLPLAIAGAGDPPQDPAQRDMQALTVLLNMAADQNRAALQPLMAAGTTAEERDHARRDDAERNGLGRHIDGDRHRGGRPDAGERLLEAAAPPPDPTRKPGAVVLTLTFAAALAALAWYHWLSRRSGFVLAPLDAAIFAAVSFFLILAHLHRDVRPRPSQAAALAKLRVTVVVPLYNEDMPTVHRMLDSLAAQTRPVQRIHIVNDGSRLAVGPDGEFDDVAAVVDGWRPLMPQHTEMRYDRIANSGKRHAQAVAFRADPDANVFVTVDSDTVLDPHAIEYGLAPLCRRKVNAVACCSRSTTALTC